MIGRWIGPLRAFTEGDMMSALECYQKAMVWAHNATKASRDTDRSMLTAKALRWIIVSRALEVKAGATASTNGKRYHPDL